MDRKIVLSLLQVGLLVPMIAIADNCPEAKDVVDHAIKDGIGATWQTGNNLNWYLDYFSNNSKPSESAASKFTFMQASLENQQLTCYYQWPSEDNKSMNWMTLRLKTTKEIKPNWQGAMCQNFEAANCQFTQGAAPTSATPTPAPSAPTTNIPAEMNVSPPGKKGP